MMKKRIISLLLTVAMLLSVLPVIANANAVDNEPFLKSVSLTLDGILRLNVKVNPGSADMSNYKVKFTLGEDAPKVCTESTQQDDLYVYTLHIPAHKLQNTVQIELLDADNAIVDKSSWTLDGYLVSIVDWDGGLSELADALELYAENAAAYVAGSASVAPSTTIEQSDLLSYKCEVVTPGTVVPSAVLLLNDACTLRVQVSASKWQEGYSLKIDGEAVALTYNATKQIYYYDVKDIRAQDWGTKYSVEIVDDGSNILYKCNYAVMSYVYTVLGKPDEFANELNLLKSMYLYFQEADNYIKAERFDYSLTYNANYEGSNETKVDSTTITATSKNFKLIGNPFQRSGYRFTGWNTAADGSGTAYQVGAKLPLAVNSTLVQYDFNNNAVSNTWTQYDNNTALAEGSVWSAADGTMKYTGADASNNSVLMFDTPINADNYQITTQVTMPSGGSVGLIFAANDNLSNFHYFRIWYTSGSYKLYAGHDTSDGLKTLNTGYGNVAKDSSWTDIAAGKSVTLKVVVEGQNFSIYANDHLWMSKTTTGANLHGKVGLIVRAGASATGHSFDDVKVSAPKMTETLYAQWEEISLFSENFNDNAVSSTWTQYDNNAAVTEGSVWSAADGAMKYTGADASNNSVLIFDTPINADNYQITTQVTMPSGGSVGLIFAANDNLSNFHYFRIWYTSGSYKLYAGHDTSDGLKTLNTGYGNVAKDSSWTDIAAGKSVTLKVVVEGQDFSIYANDHLWMSKTTTGANLHGKVGLIVRAGASATGHSFDDVKVSAPNMLINENFDNNAVFSGWTQYDNNETVTEGSAWSAADGTMKCTGNTTQNSVLLFDTVINEDCYEFSTQVTVPAAGSVGLLFAANDDLTNFHYFRIWCSGSYDYLSAGYDTEDGLKTLNSLYAGSANKSCNDIAANKAVVLKVVVDGQNFAIYANSTLLLEGTTTRANLYGKVGLFLRNGASATGHSFDDVLVVKNEAAAG